jgi:photosystem II stability/assembly factor-like uncharacterized protein
MRSVAIVVAMLSLAGPWTLQESGTDARLRGLSVVSPSIAWASGAKASVIRTIDAGATWAKLVLPDSDGLDFRDIHGFDDRSACVLAIGPGEHSRIYRTDDCGKTWTLGHVNRDPAGFLDAIAFWDADHGLALGDPVEGHSMILATDDGGRSWARIPNTGIPEALPNEGAFAASGTCLVVEGSSNAWFGTGGGKSARVFRSTDRGRTWTVAETPIRAGNPSSGVFGLAFRDANHGLAVGGDYKLETDPTGNLAVTTDGGKTWTLVARNNPAGFRSAVAFVPDSEGRKIITVGPSGSDTSTDGGTTWKPLGPPGFDALGLAGTTAWGSGSGGRIGRVSTLDLDGKK